MSRGVAHPVRVEAGNAGGGQANFTLGRWTLTPTRWNAPDSAISTTAAIAADKYIGRFKESERDGSGEATRDAVESSHISAGGYT